MLDWNSRDGGKAWEVDRRRESPASEFLQNPACGGGAQWPESREVREAP